jgi:dsDNA-specific endonuclease/ATPase MutS2
MAKGLYTFAMHHVPIEDSIDLHTFQPKEIHIVLEEYLYQAIQHGFKEVRIIHGRGVGVQREIVQKTLQRHSDVVSFRDAPDRGSTYATLRAKA